MCHRYSWIEVSKVQNSGKKVVKDILFLTDDIFQEKSFCRKVIGQGYTTWKNGADLSNFVGHTALRIYYSMSQHSKVQAILNKAGYRWWDNECTHFDKSYKFPRQLVQAIKRGKMFGLGITEDMVEEMLLKRGQKAFLKALDGTGYWTAQEESNERKDIIAGIMAFREVWKDKKNRRKCWR